MLTGLKLRGVLSNCWAETPPTHPMAEAPLAHPLAPLLRQCSQAKGVGGGGGRVGGLRRKIKKDEMMN